MVLTYVRTLYHRMGVEYEAVLVPWSEVEALLGHPHTGAAAEDRLIVQALRAAGAPGWVSEESEGWVDEEGWGLIGPEAMEAAR